MTTTSYPREITMHQTLHRPPTRRTRAWPTRWVAVLLIGVALYGAVLTALEHTQDPVYIPVLILLGAAIVPTTLTTLITELEAVPRLSVARVLTAAVLGGVIGGVLAGQLEFDAVRDLGSLPYLMIGLIEESAKLTIPVLLFAWRRPRPRAVDGLVLGVAAGSGFAAMETMGYAFVTLLQTGGQLQSVDGLLLIRAIASLGGHAAWTGLAAAAFFAIGNSRSRRLGVLRFVAVFAGVVILHALWDADAGSHGYLAVGATGLVLLATTTWWLRRHHVHHTDVAPSVPVTPPALTRPRPPVPTDAATPRRRAHGTHAVRSIAQPKPEANSS
jgi:RsiW-degrading membrane proteinase PrsW (M82 family)